MPNNRGRLTGEETTRRLAVVEKNDIESCLPLKYAHGICVLPVIPGSTLDLEGEGRGTDGGYFIQRRGCLRILKPEQQSIVRGAALVGGQRAYYRIHYIYTHTRVQRQCLHSEHIIPAGYLLFFFFGCCVFSVLCLFSLISVSRAAAAELLLLYSKTKNNAQTRRRRREGHRETR